MNFFPGELLTEGDQRVMGIRPEDLFVTEDGPLSVHVSHVEHLGGDTNVVAHIDEHQITARLFGQHQIATGENLSLGFKPESSYAFDQNGLRIA